MSTLPQMAVIMVTTGVAPWLLGSLAIVAVVASAAGAMVRQPLVYRILRAALVVAVVVALALVRLFKLI